MDFRNTVYYKLGCLRSLIDQAIEDLKEGNLAEAVLCLTEAQKIGKESEDEYK